MSGGVDSTAAAIVLKEKADLCGFFMRLHQPDFPSQLANVSSIAERLGIPLKVIDLREQFQQKVLDYFRDSYFSGLTPNPCMVCNRDIKFGLFLEAILAAGMERMATGHYARIVRDGELYRLHDGVDPTKDQSYFLARLTQHQLSHAVVPLGTAHKQETYALVARHGFTGFEAKESQDICFLSDQGVGDYLAERYPEGVRPGTVIDTDGREIGRHAGLFRYTIGQRRGLGLPDVSPWYVAGIDSAQNTLIVCKHDELFKEAIMVDDLHWLSGHIPDLDRTYMVRIRYSHHGSPARINMDTSLDQARIAFEEPQRAITPGQFAVIYDGTEVLGSGIIQ